MKIIYWTPKRKIIIRFVAELVVIFALTLVLVRITGIEQGLLSSLAAICWVSFQFRRGWKMEEAKEIRGEQRHLESVRVYSTRQVNIELAMTVVLGSIATVKLYYDDGVVTAVCFALVVCVLSALLYRSRINRVDKRESSKN